LPGLTTSSFAARSCYLWLVPLLWRGRNKDLTIDDCGDIPHELKSALAVARLEKLLLSMPNASLLSISFKAFGLQLMAPVLPRLLILIVTFAQPLLVNQMISFIVDPTRPVEQGWALLGGFICVYVVMTLSNSLYWEKVNSCLKHGGQLLIL